MTRSFIYAAADHVKRHRPRLVFVGFGETDEWAHAGRYDLYLNAAHHVDAFVQRLWDTVQSMREYRGKTTFILTADHGRGNGLQSWKDHGEKVEGAEGDWIAIIGPDTLPPVSEPPSHRLLKARSRRPLPPCSGRIFQRLPGAARRSQRRWPEVRAVGSSVTSLVPGRYAALRPVFKAW